jgi:hypothetical protein
MQPYFDNTAKAGTATGTLLTIFAYIHSEDLVRTALLATVGAVVSFCVTHALKKMVRWWRQL